MTFLFEKLVANHKEYTIVPVMGYVYIFNKNGNLFYHTEARYSKKNKLLIYGFNPHKFYWPIYDWSDVYTLHPIDIFMKRLAKEYNFFRDISIKDEYRKRLELRNKMIEFIIRNYTTKSFEFMIRKLLELQIEYPEYQAFHLNRYGDTRVYEMLRYGKKSGLNVLNNNFDIKIIL